MKDWRLLVWLTQVGLSAVLPLGGFTLLGFWLHRSQGWGKWVLILGLALGILTGARGLWDALKAMERMARGPKPKDDPPPTSFNEHL